MSFADRLRGLLGRSGAARSDVPAAAVPDAPTVTPELEALVRRVTVPCVAISLGEGAPAGTPGSYVGGHPYLPEERPWPVWEGVPMYFVGQIDFAEVPALDGFPPRGLLQWFVGADDTSGLTFDETQGTVGFEVRWYADTDRPSLVPSDAPTPWHEAEASGAEVYAAIEVRRATRLTFQAVEAVPTLADLPAGVDTGPVVKLARQVGEDADDLDFVWEEFVRGGASLFPELVHASTIGGPPHFTQQDPRGAGAFAPAASPAGRVLVELDGMEFDGWGDAGVGHLFGDPVALSHGDTSSVRYHWDCY